MKIPNINEGRSAYTIKILLFLQNYIDRRIYNYILEECEYTNISDGSIIIDIESFLNVLNDNFQEEIEELEVLEYTKDSSKYNTIFFIDNILNLYPNVKFFTIATSNAREYSRMQYDAERKMNIINFGYKIINAHIDLSKYAENENDINLINAFLKDIGILNKDIFNSGDPYIKIRAKEVVDKILLFEEKNSDNIEIIQMYEQVLNLMYSLVTQKLELDNSTIILITDYM